MTKNNTPLEEYECRRLVGDLMEMQARGLDVLFTCHPHETFTKSWSVKNRNKAMGVRKGFPDYTLIINRKCFHIEMKRQQGGQTTKEQKVWIDKLCDAGQDVYICKGRDEALKVIQRYL